MNSTPNAVPSSQVPPVPRGGGGGCCAVGCFTMLAIAFVAVALVVGGTWYLYAKTVDALTSEAPLAVQLEPASEAQFAAASEKLDRIRSAAATNEATTVEFTALDLNALIARHPSFSDWRGKVRVGIANSIATLDLSVPLSAIALPRVSRRWFNGSVSLGMTYDQDRFALAVKTLTANGQNVNLDLFQSIADVMNDSFNEGFDKAQSENAASNEFWDRVESMSIVDDKLIITTKGAAPDASTV